MKKIINISLCVVAVATFLSCNKSDDNDHQASYEPLRGLAYLKVVHIAPNFRKIFNTADSFNIYVDQTKLNGTFLKFNDAFPTVTTNSNTYATVLPGDHKLRFTKINNPVGTNPVSILEMPRTFVSGEKYSLLLTDSIITNSSYNNIWLKDDFAIPDTTKVSLRFVNALLNDTLGKTVDVYSKVLKTNIFSNVPVKGVVDFTLFPYTLVPDTLFVRRSGTINNLATLNQGPLTTFVRKRVYTVIFKGNTTFPTTDAKNKNILVYTNY